MDTVQVNGWVYLIAITERMVGLFSRLKLQFCQSKKRGEAVYTVKRWD